MISTKCSYTLHGSIISLRRPCALFMHKFSYNILRIFQKYYSYLYNSFLILYYNFLNNIIILDFKLFNFEENLMKIKTFILRLILATTIILLALIHIKMLNIHILLKQLVITIIININVLGGHINAVFN